MTFEEWAQASDSLPTSEDAGRESEAAKAAWDAAIEACGELLK